MSRTHRPSVLIFSLVNGENQRLFLGTERAWGRVSALFSGGGEAGGGELVHGLPLYSALPSLLFVLMFSLLVLVDEEPLLPLPGSCALAVGCVVVTTTTFSMFASFQTVLRCLSCAVVVIPAVITRPVALIRAAFVVKARHFFAGSPVAVTGLPSRNSAQSFFLGCFLSVVAVLTFS